MVHHPCIIEVASIDSLTENLVQGGDWNPVSALAETESLRVRLRSERLKVPLPAAPSDLPAMQIVSLSDHTVAIANYREPLLWFADLSTGAVTTTTLDSPEVRAAVAKRDAVSAKAGAIRPLLFYDAAATARGHILVAVDVGPVSAGMLLVEFDSLGQYVRGFRLKAPALDRVKRDGNAEGWVSFLVQIPP
jgi:hypothetical protein